MTGYVLPHLDTNIGNVIGFGMAIHRRVQLLAGVWELVANDIPCAFKKWDSEFGGSFVFIIQNTDMPRACFIWFALQCRRKAVEGQDKFWAMLRQQLS